MGITEIGIYVLLFFTFLLICIKMKSQGNYPPGPWGLPIFGNLFSIGDLPHKKFSEWKRKYGPLFSIDLGAHRSVVINDYKLIKEAMNDDAFSGRPQLQHQIDRCGGEIKGIIFTENHEWAEQRHLALNHLIEVGSGKKPIETIILREIEELLKHLISDSDKTISTQSSINAAVINVLCAIVTGERFKHEDSEFHSISKTLNTFIQEKNSISLLGTFIPWIGARGSGYIKILENTARILSFLRNRVENHKKTFEIGQHRDFLDIYLDEIKNTSDPDSSFYREKGMKSSLFTLMDILIAGSEKTSTALTWILLYLAKYPEIQSKLQSEIETIVGKSRLPTLADKPKMIYSEAVIHESLRFSSSVPLSVFHKTTKETQLGGFTIPSGTMIVPNLYDAHFDKSAWGDPQNFRPERWIVEEKFVTNEAFLAFGVGKRSCIGENLTRDQLFLFVVSIFQRFSVLSSSSGTELSIEPVGSFTLTPKSHNLVLKDRF